MSLAADTSASPASPASPRGPRSELAIYLGRIREFDRTDWRVYLAWVGTMLGLVASTGGFLVVGASGGVRFPTEAWLVPVGAFVFSAAIAVDTIGHRTIYKEVLRGGEALVHQITILCGVASCVSLVLAYQHPALWIPAMVFTALSFIYSLVDEIFHWRRYVSAHADRVEMWSHVFIFIGHGTMMLGWWRFYQLGYPGVAETLRLLAP
jgi:hypothetical protein